MGLNDTPSANRIHIGFFGKRNAGKSSVVNAVANQDLAVVSARKGTTTDPVSKAMELLPLGPVVVIDTPGYDDDEADLGKLRIRRVKRVLNKTDIAVLVVDGTVGMDRYDQELIQIFKEKDIPYITVFNKSDLSVVESSDKTILYVSAVTKSGINDLRERLGMMAPKGNERRLIGDLIEPNAFIVLVTPIDESAPKGRMILPQVQTLRDILDSDAVSIVTKETQLEGLLKGLGKSPDLVITDSQVFKTVASIVPDDIALTSFSILMARYKGFLNTAVRGVAAIRELQAGEIVLIAEGCTHHRQCNDIGTVKIPNWLRQFTGNKANIETCSGTEFPEDLSKYAVVIHCGGCMLNEREMRYRAKCALDQNVPFTNYGVTIAHIHGVLYRSLGIFPELQNLLKP